MEAVDYEQQARTFLAKHELTLSIIKSSLQRPTPWGGPYQGELFLVTISRRSTIDSLFDRTQQALRFDFWGSYNDKMNGRTPSAYDVLACISMDSSLPTDPDEVIQELGADIGEDTAFAAAKFARKLQNFFTESELNDLWEIG